MKITGGLIPTAKKVVIYGPEGIGKSTFASKFPRPVFIDTEGSTSHMDVRRFDPPKSWDELMAIVEWCIQNTDQMGTLVIDTMDWAEPMAFQKVIDSKKSADLKSIEDIPYGKGYVMAKEVMMKLLKKLDELKDKGVNVVLVCHAIVRKFEQPDEMGSYDRYTLKLNEKNIAPLIREWSDMLLFANYRTDVVTTQDGKKKGTGGRKRVMYTAHAAAWDAKNRFGLADELPFDFDSIAHLFGKTEPLPQSEQAAPEPEAKKPAARAKKKAQSAPPERPDSMRSADPEKDAALAQLWDMMCAINVTDPLIVQSVVGTKEYYPLETTPNEYDTEFINDVLIAAWDQVSDMLLSYANNLPF